MPEMHFKIQWPDGSEEACYSPSLIIKKYFQPGQDYSLTDLFSPQQLASIASLNRSCGYWNSSNKLLQSAQYGR
jgi:uncharacterized repeat protein (TIGR04042 family)